MLQLSFNSTTYWPLISLWNHFIVHILLSSVADTPINPEKVEFFLKDISKISKISPKYLHFLNDISKILLNVFIHPLMDRNSWVSMIEKRWEEQLFLFLCHFLRKRCYFKDVIIVSKSIRILTIRTEKIHVSFYHEVFIIISSIQLSPSDASTFSISSCSSSLNPQVTILTKVLYLYF